MQHTEGEFSTTSPIDYIDQSETDVRLSERLSVATDSILIEMASTTRDNGNGGVEFVYEEDGRVTAKDIETGVASFGDDRAEALRMLADALDAYHGKGEPVDDDELAAELGLSEDEIGSEGRPPWDE
ncbi:hypothetical protein SAMN04487950_0504 [Halogranum rubrum]|uniref:HicB family protein n=2 Tax=Halogranum rubrum TaxID=553466 RepID=A0A1I4BGG9_9EURY|nr:hypothetical protein SAMN04487950_0504 [Halogranum rubrum]